MTLSQSQIEHLDKAREMVQDRKKDRTAGYEMQEVTLLQILDRWIDSTARGKEEEEEECCLWENGWIEKIALAIN